MSKKVEEVLFRIDSTIKAFEKDEDPVTFPLQYTSSLEWGFGIHCAKGYWVAECEEEISQEVLSEFEKRNKDK